jgi:hypothetical protein
LINNGINPDIADAFQHVIWMAYMTRHTKASVARDLGYAHEADTKQRSNDPDDCGTCETTISASPSARQAGATIGTTR